jgi:hypothetical protein
MSNKKFLFTFLCFILLVCHACKEGQPTAVLEVYVLDVLGNRVENAKVNIYKFKEDWEKERNALKPEEVTTTTGLVRFVNLEEGTYYIDVQSRTQNNWEGKIETTVQSIGAFYVNTEFIIVKESRSGDVAQANGRKWRAVSLLQLGKLTPVEQLEPIFRCTYDNLLIFYKGGTYTIEGRGVKCQADEPAIVERGTWRFNEAGTVLTLRSSNREVNWAVLESSPTRVVFQESILTILGVVNIDVTYVLATD